MHRFSHGTMPLRNIFKVSARVLPAPPTGIVPFPVHPQSHPLWGQASSEPCLLSELHLLLGLRRLDGLLHQPPSLYAPQ